MVNTLTDFLQAGAMTDEDAGIVRCMASGLNNIFPQHKVGSQQFGGVVLSRLDRVLSMELGASAWRGLAGQ
jgi:hypothetical protein